jgi:hypothetical protein
VEVAFFNGVQQQSTATLTNQAVSATAIGGSAEHSHDPGQLGICPPEMQTVEDQRLGATGMNNLRMFRARMDNEQ